MEHFGVNVKAGPKNGLRLERGQYARINKRNSTWVEREIDPERWDATASIYEDEDHRFYTDEWCERWQARALENFDLNMAFFAQLDSIAFEEAVAAAVKSVRSMREVVDLNKWDGKAGVYLMVLDEYKQVYVGTAGESTGIMKRIRKHWSTTKAFDRLLWGRVEESILSIDSFRALDTTRIFAASVRDPMVAEYKLVEKMPRRYLLNRIMGGSGELVAFAGTLGADWKRTRELRPASTPQK